MAHNFIWTSKDVENCPTALYCGVEFVDGMMKTFNQNPEKKEYLMGEDKVNSDFDTSKVTADWFHAEVKVNGTNTYLWVNVYDPAGEKPEEKDSHHSSNLQILADGSHVYLEMVVSSTILDNSMNDARYMH